MSEIKEIGMYSTDEILKHLTEGEGRGFLGRSIFDAIYFKIEELENINEKLSLALNSAESKLQQKENVIKEAREKLKEHKHDLDYEPWSEYKIKGSILFALVGILGKEVN